MRFLSKLFVSGAVAAVCLAAPTAAFASTNDGHPGGDPGFGNCQQDPGHHNGDQGGNDNPWSQGGKGGHDPKGSQDNNWNDPNGGGGSQGEGQNNCSICQNVEEWGNAGNGPGTHNFGDCNHQNNCDPRNGDQGGNFWGNQPGDRHDGGQGSNDCQNNCDPHFYTVSDWNPGGHGQQQGDHGRNGDPGQGNCNRDPGQGYGDNGGDGGNGCKVTTFSAVDNDNTFLVTTKVTVGEVLNVNGQTFTVTHVDHVMGGNYKFEVTPSVPQKDIKDEVVTFSTVCDHSGDPGNGDNGHGHGDNGGDNGHGHGHHRGHHGHHGDNGGDKGGKGDNGHGDNGHNGHDH